MKLTKPFSDNSAVALLISSLAFIGACSGTDMKGNSEAAAKAKENKTTDTINSASGAKAKENKTTDTINSANGADSETGKLECKPGEVLKGTNADKSSICTPKIADAQPGAGVTKEKAGTDIKDALEFTTCDPGSADLTTFTSETSQATDLHIVSVLKSYADDKLTDKPIEVIVKKRTKPVIIVLYSPTRESQYYNESTPSTPLIKWDIKEEEGANISKIFVIGVNNINGVIFSKRNEFTPGFTSTNNTGGGHSNAFLQKAWQYPSTESLVLITDAQKATGLTVKKFQGCSISGKFIVN